MHPERTMIHGHGADGWWIATIPEIPGAFSQVRTKEAARENVFDATAELMAARKGPALRKRAADRELESPPMAAAPQKAAERRVSCDCRCVKRQSS